MDSNDLITDVRHNSTKLSIEKIRNRQLTIDSRLALDAALSAGELRMFLETEDARGAWPATMAVLLLSEGVPLLLLWLATAMSFPANVHSDSSFYRLSHGNT